MLRNEIMIHELAQMSEDNRFQLSETLSKFLDVARALKLHEFNLWLLSELNGYRGAEADLPTYRTLRGEVIFRNFNNHPIVVEMNNPQLDDTFREIKILDSIRRLETFIDCGLINYEVKLSKDQQRIFHKLAEMSNTTASVLIHRNQIVRLLDEIKLSAQQWIKELEHKF